MRDMRRAVAIALGCGLFAGVALARTDASEAHSPFRVELGSTLTQPASGRLLLFATDAKAAIAAAKDGKVDEVDANPFGATQASVAAREVSRLVPGQGVEIDADALAYPAGWSQLPPGDYFVQAVLDVDHSYNYSGRGAGDLVSSVVKLHLPAATPPRLSLDRVLSAREPWDLPARYLSDTTRKHLDAARRAAQPLDFVSPALSAFWGRPIHMRGWVLLPPGYDPHAKQSWPVVYATHGYGGSAASLAGNAAMVYGAMAEHQMPPMIWVFLDQSSPTGTHEFADSVNNGPWGWALTTELIPQLESRYRMDARPSGRFLTGHSSGGWATLWLQTRYPKIFGGTWSTSPDPSDFHDFTGVDLYAPHANVYRKPDGTPYPLVRDKGKVLASFEAFAQLERVLGEYGGQMASFEWVFSPRGADGRPLPMFDRDTGAVDPAVVAYWREHYDIAHLVQANWPRLKGDLDGKIHLVVGTADTFYLDGAAHKFKAVLDGLGAKSDFRFLPGKTHFDLYAQGKDRQGLLKQMAWEMYAVARPDSKLKRRAAAAP
ncbi:alpha/beta hydrolase [Rhodanobacter denitrificans]|uniref:Enterochelin esterase-like enzyme n=1 Tax=Rhodanobacter denitrificans TaxID=666685 RepID=M4NCW8_9GAMM|nr:alpha/beta hydrolase-fold protein [Rhodanobacter denitrificans]AGG88550.1 enterochelin esterase-like enzyme [Rhodanobacter denitrificans]UJJ58779.1 enterochelin esterase [Rhodanobacter denitrificans]UJM87688.1 enterochelin esterase [Rhodanobacter denitrificans]